MNKQKQVYSFDYYFNADKKINQDFLATIQDIQLWAEKEDNEKNTYDELIRQEEVKF